MTLLYVVRPSWDGIGISLAEAVGEDRGPCRNPNYLPVRHNEKPE